MYVSVEDIKKQVNVDSNEDDRYLSDLIEVSEVAISNMINIGLADLEDENGTIPAPLRHAIKLVAANLYENREPVAYAKATNVAFTLGFLVGPYVNLT